MSKQTFDSLRIDIWISGTADKSGKGGYAAYMYSLLKGHPYKKTIGGYAYDTTITRMTLKAMVEALKCIKNPSFIHFYTSLPYISAGLNRNLSIWKKNDWMRKDNKFLKHADLWEEVSHLLDEKALTYKVHYQKEESSRDNELYVLHKSSEYLMKAKRNMHEVLLPV